MNYKTACANLNISLSEEITTDILKRQYRTLALKYHPDKSNDVNAAARFQEIHESYDYLMKYKDFLDAETSSDDDDSNEDSNPRKQNYKTILVSFLKNVLLPENRKQLYYTILKQISSTCESNALEILNTVEKQNLIKIYEILENYKDVLHFKEDFLTKIKEIINDKSKNDECIILNPTIDDLFENNLYKLKINGFTYIVPLWHNELVYDNSGNDIYVKCIPNLPDNIFIDDKNNMTVFCEYNIHDIWDKETLTINIGKQELQINKSALKIKETQDVLFVKQGISRFNTKNIYDISNKGDVTIKVKINLL